MMFCQSVSHGPYHPENHQPPISAHIRQRAIRAGRRAIAFGGVCTWARAGCFLFAFFSDWQLIREIKQSTKAGRAEEPAVTATRAPALPAVARTSSCAAQWQWMPAGGNSEPSSSSDCPTIDVWLLFQLLLGLLILGGKCKHSNQRRQLDDEEAERCRWWPPRAPLSRTEQPPAPVVVIVVAIVAIILGGKAGVAAGAAVPLALALAYLLVLFLLLLLPAAST